MNFCPDHLGEKGFGPGFFIWMLYLFKVRKLGTILAHGQQFRNGSTLLCDVISVFHSCAKQTKTKRDAVAFFFYKMPDSCIIFGCNNKSDSESGRALHRIHFFKDHHP